MLSIHVAVFLFGLAGLFAKLVSCPPAVIVFGRTLLAAVALLPFARGPFSWRLLPAGALLAAHWVSFFYSIQISTVATGLLGFATFPVFVTFLEPIFSKQRLHLKDLAMALVVSIGLALVIPQWSQFNQVALGALWGTFSGLTFALLTLLNRSLVQSHSPLVITMYQTAAAALLVLPWAAPSLPSVSLSDWGRLAVLGIVCTAVSHTLFIRGLQTVRAHVAGILASLEPVYGILLAIPLLHEVPSERTLLGGCIILAAAFYASVCGRAET